MPYSPRAKMAVIKMHEDGMSLREIEWEFGIDRKDIRDWISRYEKGGVDALGRRQNHYTSLEIRCAAVKDFIEEGLTYKQLSEKYNISRGQLKILVSRYREGGYEGLKERRRGRPPKINSSQD